eukprot:gene235-3613_t
MSKVIDKAERSCCRRSGFSSSSILLKQRVLDVSVADLEVAFAHNNEKRYNKSKKQEAKMSFFQRVAAWLANEAVTNSLAKSQTFQKFAQRTHEHATKISHHGMKAAENFKKSDAARNFSSQAGERFQQARTFGQSFVRNLKENYKRLEEEGKQRK